MRDRRWRNGTDRHDRRGTIRGVGGQERTRREADERDEALVLCVGSGENRDLTRSTGTAVSRQLILDGGENSIMIRDFSRELPGTH